MALKSESFELTAPGGHAVFYRALVPESPRAALLALHGLAEHSGYYGEAMDALAAAGVAVFAPDHRGHGYSGGAPGDLQGLEEALGDIGLVHEALRQRVPDAPLFVLGHSFGGQLALLYALRRQGELAGVILSSPLVLVPPYVSPLLVRITGLVARLLPRLPLQGFAHTRTTRNPEAVEQMLRDPLYYKGKIRARTGSALLAGMQEATRRLEELSLPLLVLHGERDETVEPACSRTVIERAASRDKILKLFPEAMHHLLLEPEAGEILKLIGEWILERAA